jgi:excisionase family DNA binding protein
LTNNPYKVIVIPMELTTAQAAEKLGVSQSRVRQFVLAGRIKPRYLTRRMMLIDEKELAKVRNRKPGRPWPNKVKGKR